MKAKRSFLERTTVGALLLVILAAILAASLYQTRQSSARSANEIAEAKAGADQTAPPNFSSAGGPPNLPAGTSTSVPPAGEGPLTVFIKDRLTIGPVPALFRKAAEKIAAVSGAKAMPPDRAEENREDERERGIAAQAFRNLQLQDENGIVPTDAYQKARGQIATMKALQVRKPQARGMRTGTNAAGIDRSSWTWLGPGNIGGRIRSIAIDPTNVNSIWVGSVSGGIWHTADAGASWLPVDDFMANLAVSSLIIDPTNPNVMYAGTGEWFASGDPDGESFSTDGLRGSGIFISTDHGVTWNQMSNTDPNDPSTGCVIGAACRWHFVNRLSIASDGQHILAATLGGIEMSENAGALWKSGVNAAGVFVDVDYDPQDPQNAVAGQMGGSMYSTDGGSSWTAAVYNPAIVLSNPKEGRVELAYAPSNPTIVYALVNVYGPTKTKPWTTQGVVYRSLDGGRQFSMLTESIPGNTFLGDQGIYDNIIWVNPVDEHNVIVGGINMYQTMDAGQNWTPIANGNSGSPHSDHHMVVASPAFDNSSNKQVYVTNDGGIYRTDDISTASLTSGWTKLNNNLGITQFYSATATAGRNIVGGTQDNGTIKFNGASVPWTETWGGDGGFVAADPIDPNYVYGEYINLAVSRSTDGGWSGPFIFCDPAPTDGLAQCVSPATGIMDANNGANFIAPLVLDPNNSSRMLAGGLSLWETTNLKAAGIPSWTVKKNPTLTTRSSPGHPAGESDPISAIAVSPNNPDFMVVGHNDGQIFLTFNGTNSPLPDWYRISSNGVPAPARYVTRLVIDETRSPNWIYATFGGFADGNIYVTKDLGNTWIDVSGAGGTSIPNVPVRSLLINPIHRDYLYAGTEFGVFTSEDGGATWKMPQDGPANVSVDDLFWYNGRLGAATFGRGVYLTAPLFVTNGGSGSGGGGASGTACNQQGSGSWFDPLSWPALGHVPLSTDDVAVVCPVFVSAPAGARNIRVNATLTLNSDLGTSEDLAVFGVVQRNISLPGKAAIYARNFSNSGNVSIHSLSATGEAVNGANLNLIDNLQSGNLRNAGTLTVTDVTVGGDFDNSGSMTGNVLSFAGPTHNLQGTSAPKFANMVVQNGQTVKFLSDMTFDIAVFNSNGTMDFNGKTLKFLGNTYQSGGGVLGTGTLRLEPTLGTVALAGNAPAVNVVSGTADFQGAGTFSGPLNVGPGTTFRLDAAPLTLMADATVNGIVTRETTYGGNIINFFGTNFANNGGVTADVVRFNPSGPTPLSQNIAGLGVWSGDVIAIGNASAAAPSTVTLQNDVTFASKEIQVGYTFNLNGHVLSYIGTGNQFGIAVSNSGSIVGPGTFKLQPASGTPVIRSLNSAATWGSELKVASGTVRADLNSASFVTIGPLTIDSGATLRLGSGFSAFDARDNVINNGTIELFGTGPYMYFRGNTFTNNGSIAGLGVYFWPLAAKQMAISGGGAWTGDGVLYFDASADTSFTSDVTYGSGSITTNGPFHGLDPYVFSVPCNVSWTGPGEVTGKIRRTNLAACSGAVKYGNANTSIAFTSGTPPSEVLVSVESSPLVPAGFPGAVRRLYTITPTGGSGYTATLRLHYLDSELNDNDESSLELYRFDGTLWTRQGASNRDTVNNWVEYSGVTQFSPWSISGPQAPTASNVSVAGQARTSSGMGVNGAVITLTAPDRTVWTAITNPLGYYRFDDVPGGASYIINVSSKRFTFAHRSLVISVTEDTSEIDFVADAPQ